MNKTVLITGTSSGLGLCLAKHFIECGWNVIGIARRTVVLPNYTHYNCDISDKKNVIDTFNLLGKTLKIDLLINNAGMFTLNNFSQSTLDDITHIIGTNLGGTMYVTRLALDIMSDNSKIIFINSVAGLEEVESQSIYCASKYGLTAFAGVLGKELRGRKIKVSSIHPGGIKTPLWDRTAYPLVDVEKTMDPSAVIEIIDMIVNSKHDIDYKTIKLFPSIEWHN